MIVVADTCAILMLVRICPDMFKDAKYNCVMLREAYAEYTKSVRFKRQYPWRESYRTCLASLTESQLNAVDYAATLDAVKAAAQDTCDRDMGGKSYYDELSCTDLKTAAAACAFEGAVCTGDGALMRFSGQELELPVMQPLAVVNRWLSDGVLACDDGKQSVLEDWVRTERRQPSDDIRRFEALSGRRYPTR